MQALFAHRAFIERAGLFGNDEIFGIYPGDLVSGRKYDDEGYSDNT